jgi:predicted GIY-YIG superfamily endonuclease
VDIDEKGPVEDVLQSKQCVYTIPCDCGGCYIGETDRPLQVRIKEHKYSRTQDLFQKSNSAEHAYEEAHQLCWNEATALQIETNIYRKYKELANSSLAANPITYPSSDLSPNWIPPVKKLEKYVCPCSYGSIGRFFGGKSVG